MSSRGESKIPSLGSGGSGAGGATSGAPKKKSLLPAPKTLVKPLGIPRPTARERLTSQEKSPEPIEPSADVTITVTPESQFRIGDRVKISGVKTGVVHFIGRTHFAEGQWCGVALDEADGRHDGQVEGVKYFQCAENHGIFAPVHKVELCPEDLYMYDSPGEAPYSSEDEPSSDKRSPSLEKKVMFQREKSTPPEKVTRLPQPKTHTRSKSLDSDISKSPEQSKSKLARPKSFSRSLNGKDNSALGDSTSSSRESSVSRDADKSPRSKPSKLSQPKGAFRKAEKRSAKHVTREALSEDEHAKVDARGKKSKTSHQDGGHAGGLDGTFIKEDAEDDVDYVPAQNSPPRVDTKTALTLAYNLESSGSDSEATKQLNTTFDKKSSELPGADNNLNATFDVSVNLNTTFIKDTEADTEQLSKPSSGAASSLQSPIPDLLTSAGFVRQASLEWEEEPDVMCTSTSSLGILTETQLMDNSLLGEEFYEMLRKKEQQKRELEGIEAEVDKEIAGIATPEIDMSSSTISGKESSPEPEARPTARVHKKENFDLTFDHLQIKTSTPLSPPSALKAAGEKLATPVSENIGKDSQIPATKLYEETLIEEANTHSPERMDVDSDSEGQSVDTYVVAENGEDIDIKSGSKRKRTSTDLDEIKCHRLSASFELAKTAVEQYASLVKGAEEEKANKKIEDTRLAALRKSDIMTTSMEGRVAKIASDEVEGLEDVSFPSDVMASFIRAVERQQSDDSPTELTSSFLSQKPVDNITFIQEKCASQNKNLSVEIEQDPDSLNAGMEHAISQDSLDSLDNLHKKKNELDNANATVILSTNDVDPALTAEVVEQRQVAVVDQLEAVTEDQLRAELAASHGKRPVSLVSSCSADTGIMVESVERLERPMSMVSTSSVDTGYQDTELVPMTTTSPLPGSDGIEELEAEPSSDRDGIELTVEDAGVKDTTFTKGGMSAAQYSPDGTSDEDKDPESIRDAAATATRPESDWAEADMDGSRQAEVERENGGDSEPEETSGTESQQGEDTTVQEVVTPETDADMDEADLSPDPPTNANTTATIAVAVIGAKSHMSNGECSKEESMEITDTSDPVAVVTEHTGDSVALDDNMEVEMVESATMKDVMEKCETVIQDTMMPAEAECRASPPEVLVQELSVEAHVTEREVPTMDQLPHVDETEVRQQKVEESVALEMDECESRIREGSEVSGTVADGDVAVKEAEDMEVCSEDKSDGGVIAERSQIKEESGQGDAKPSLLSAKPNKTGIKQKSPHKKKDGESTPVLTSKNPRPKISSDSKSDLKKPSPKLVIKSSGGSLKRPPSVAIKSADKMDSKKSTSKTLKNVSNKKKVDVSSSSSASPGSSQKGTPEKKLFGRKQDPSKEKERQLVKARKQLDLLQSVPSGPDHLTSVEVRPVLGSGSGDEMKPSPPAARRSLGNPHITKPKPAGTKAIPKPGSRLGLPRPSSGLAAKRPSALASATGGGSETNTETTESKVPKRMLPSRIGSRLPPRGVSGIGDSGTASVSDGSDKGSRPSSAGSRLSKPSGVMALKKTDRSHSIGSDTQLSDISQVSSQGHKSETSGTSTSTTPRKPPTGKRKSLVEPGIKRPGAPDPGRRATLAVTTSSRLIGPKATGLSKGGHAPLATSTPAPKRTSNQNKNKPVRASTSSPSSGSHGNTASSSTTTSRRPNQPDLVSNAISSDNNCAEIARLEALCEARTKELSKVQVQLQHRGTGLEAMTVLVKYLTEELNAFSCPLLTAQLAEAKSQLQRAAHQLEELTNQRDALIAEIQCIKSQHTAEVERLDTEHKAALHALEDRLGKEKDDEITQVTEKHSHEVKTLMSFHERRVVEIETDRDKVLKQKEVQYEEELTRRKQAYDKQLSELHQEHESKLTEITMRFENIKINLLEKVEYLRSEGEDLRRREASMLEKCQRDSEYKYQHALAQYKQEADSLHAVMDLRNAEIHDLRRRNGEMEKQLEELPAAKEKVKALTQQVENLQAIIDIRADNERTLAEKHSVLLRKYDRESKAMKRLSMDNEELTWRLSMSMSESGSPDSFRRSISHSPTNSECSTPEPSRRLKSPMPPHSPRSPVDTKKYSASPTMAERAIPPASNLRRSGTYELLNQGFEEESKHTQQQNNT